MKKIKGRQLVILGLVLCSFTAICQDFEGSITYRMTAQNPNPEMLADSVWQQILEERLGGNGGVIQKYYYKESNYMSEIQSKNEAGYQVFNPKDSLLYSWHKNSDTAITVDSQKYLDSFVEILTSEEKDTILGIPCKSIVVKSKMGKVTLWYNSDYLKMNPEFYQGHIYGHWTQILEAIKCLPLKIEQSGFMSKTTQVAIDYKSEKVDDAQFKLPSFKEIIVNPLN